MSVAAAGREERWLAAAVLACVCGVYAASLSGGWVWDDAYQLRDNPAITDPLVLVTHDVWGPTGFADPRNTPVYRPLAMASHVPGQSLARAAWPERVLGLLLHLAAVCGVALAARGAGASVRAAWFGGALFGLHPAATEAVAWVSARADLLGVALLAGAFAAAARGRPLLAGVLAALTPFCKEAFVLAPLALGLWMLGLRRVSWPGLGAAALGVVAYLAIRAALAIPLPGGDGAGSGLLENVGALGALAGRGVFLLLWPGAPEALTPYQGRPLLGALALLVGLAALPWLPGRPWLAALVAPLVLLVPAAPASLANGWIGDRYFYPALLGVGLAAALGFAALERRRRPLAPALLLAPLLLAPFAASRAGEWRSNASLFGATLERRPDDPEALFHVAYDLHTNGDGCRAALPLYARAMRDVPRAANNYQACLLELGRLDEAARIGAALAESDGDNPTPALNTARALSQLGDQQGAEHWAREGIRRQPRRSRSYVLLGNVLGIQERYAEALAAFEQALDLDPALKSAQRGRALAMRHLAEGHDS